MNCLSNKVESYSFLENKNCTQKSHHIETQLYQFSIPSQIGRSAQRLLPLRFAVPGLLDGHLPEGPVAPAGFLPWAGRPPRGRHLQHR